MKLGYQIAYFAVLNLFIPNFLSSDRNSAILSIETLISIEIEFSCYDLIIRYIYIHMLVYWNLNCVMHLDFSLIRLIYVNKPSTELNRVANWVN